MITKSRISNPFILIVLSVITIGILIGQNAMAQKQHAQSSDESEILQFTSSGHVMGFNSKGVYVAAGTHVLREGFVGTGGVLPKTDKLIKENNPARPLGKVVYPNLWKGITLAYDRPPGGILRSTYMIELGSDPGQIALRYNTPVHLNASGNLVFEFNNGTMIASAPVAWQEIDGKKVPVDAAFRLDDSNEAVRFKLGNYNLAFPLIIDPTLTWHTFLGGETFEDQAYAVAVDDSGNVYVVGDSDGEWGNPVNEHGIEGQQEVFVAKLNRNGELQWNTFMGGYANDRGRGVAVDGSGNVYVTGDSNWGWGIPVNDFSGGGDVFVAKLNSSGATVWHTFMGTSHGISGGIDGAGGIAIDGSGYVYATGSSESTWGSPIASWSGTYTDAFAAKLNSASGTIVWTTFIGTNTSVGSTISGGGVAVDGTGNVYVLGSGNTTWGSPVNAFAGGSDVFVAKLNSSGAPVWHTFMGSTSATYADKDRGIAVDEDGNVYVAGDGRVAWGSPINNHAGNNKEDVFAVKLNSNGVRQWHTFLGSSEEDFGGGIAVDRNGNIYLTGHSSSSWGDPVNDHSGLPKNYDVFVVKLKNNGTRLWNTFMGCSLADLGKAIAVDQKAYVYVAGYSYATWGSPVRAYQGNQDAFVARLLMRAITPWKPLLLLE